MGTESHQEEQILIVRDRYRYGFSTLIFLAWIATTVVTGAIGFFLGVLFSWTWLYLTAGNINFPKMYKERLRERNIQFFLGMLAFTHIFAGVVVELAVPNWLWVFLLIGGIHVGLEVFVILTRKPKDAKKVVKLARGIRSTRKYITFK